ncbi:hypothetical protein ACA910_001072 [Epithemia clementina (nom. ined.)]
MVGLKVYRMSWGLAWAVALLLLQWMGHVEAAPSSANGEKTDGNVAQKPQSPRRIITLAESIKSTMKSLEDPEVEEIRKQYWRKTLQDIRKLSSVVMSEDQPPLLSQWKQLLDLEEPAVAKKAPYTVQNSSATDSDVSQIVDTLEMVEDAPALEQNNISSMVVTIPRFEGFPSWERMLQDWADEVQEYMQQVEKESGSEYMLANYGRPLGYKRQDAKSTLNDTSVDPLHVEAEVAMNGEKLAPYVSDDLDDEEEEEDVLELVKVQKPVERSAGRKSRRSRKQVVPAPLAEGELALPHTDLSDKSKRIEIVTTASLPWKTGTAVNPLLRAAYMLEGRQEMGGSVTLMLPWLERRADQERVYGPGSVFETPEDQEAYIRTWLRDSANMPEASEQLRIRWYTAWQNRAENSIYSMGDITALIPAEDVDICILEEPEHLNWYRAPGESWTKKFKHVVGILHTNYFQYALDQPAALIRAPAMRLLCSWMCRAHCHRIIKLSGTIDKVAPDKELVENVHGVRGTFLDVGEDVSQLLRKDPTKAEASVFGAEAEPTIYFIGKLLWSKGLGSLMELLKYFEESAGIKVMVDMYGGGPDKDAAEAKSKSLDLDMPFHGPLDHAELAYTHKIFVNPSTSEVLCTTSAEALAMGKFLIVPSHVSNDFFAQFPNCLSYASKEEFVGNLFYAMTHSPEPLSKEYLDALSWKAATQRLEAAGCIPVAEAERMEELNASREGGVEIPLPLLIENETRRKQISTTLRYTRRRFMQFRSRLSSEILQNKVLPKKLKERLAADLQKKLDLEIEEMLESPKLRLKLSPAELDKTLLELYDSISAGPSGDVLRVIGGGGSIGLQNMYMRRQAMKQRRRSGRSGSDLFPFDLGDTDLQQEGDRSTRIRWALRRNLPPKNSMDSSSSSSMLSSSLHNRPAHGKAKEVPKMALLAFPQQRSTSIGQSWSGLAAPRPTLRYPTKQRSCSLLI